MSKKNKNIDDKEKNFIKKDADLDKKGTLDRSVVPPWPVDPKRKSGANDRGHRNRP